MARRSDINFDQIGYWSEIKLDIIKEYASAYSKILAAQRQPRLYHVYIDGFAGTGANISKTSQEYVLGSPLNALILRPKFREYHLIDVNRRKTTVLDKLVEALGEKERVSTYAGDCNRILLQEIFPRVKYEDYRRGLCVLDPYGLHLRWEVIQTAGRLRSIDMFLNFPVMDMNRKVIWHDPKGVRPSDIKRMEDFWGDTSWKDIAYSTSRDLFGHPEKEDNETIAEAFRQRLQKVAGFSHVPSPIPMRNSKGSVVYYLFFASQKPVAAHIIEKISESIVARVRKMAEISAIEWTDATWNPVTGCTKISPGCKNCYAERLALRLKEMGNPRYKNGFRITLHPDQVDLPLRWTKPKMIFVNSMSDLFQDAVPDEYIKKVFEIMVKANWHIFQVLTKRAERLAKLAPCLPWPPHIWQGVSVENQAYTKRVLYLQKVPATVRFLSVEPLLGPVPRLPLDGIHWVIVGGESGPRHRPVKAEWVRDIRKQCLACGIPFFFKQWGGRTSKSGGRVLDGCTWNQMPAAAVQQVHAHV